MLNPQIEEFSNLNGRSPGDLGRMHIPRAWPGERPETLHFQQVSVLLHQGPHLESQGAKPFEWESEGKAHVAKKAAEADRLGLVLVQDQSS